MITYYQKCTSSDIEMWSMEVSYLADAKIIYATVSVIYQIREIYWTFLTQSNFLDKLLVDANECYQFKQYKRLASPKTNFKGIKLCIWPLWIFMDVVQI